MKKIFILLLLSLVMVGCNTDNGTEPNVEVEQLQNSLVVEVLRVDETEEDKWDELGEGKTLVLVEVRVANRMEEYYEFNPNYVYLKVDGGDEYPTHISPKEGDILNMKDIGPEEEIIGIVPFEIDKGKEFTIMYYDFEREYEL